MNDASKFMMSEVKNLYFEQEDLEAIMNKNDN